ncbi:hypothetical protein K458DRAFT_424950 [Lentithecium fluviatile CBS 122367]|uniref:Uncharacterized protein n=1 Tax=Lentithecium fluviatile CBS 122367 TaxID=1168545 RepID=A0A6G1IDC2_9PLEO|nr:hypothetical protein K458DRAFT_424950 [Lentithecium fluviatile CBS 122367]
MVINWSLLHVIQITGRPKSATTTIKLLRLLNTMYRPRTLPSLAAPARRTLTTTPRMLLKEDANRSPEQIEKKKQEQLKKQEEGKGEWHESLASSSESHIAADKHDVKDHDSHMSKLQEETKKKGDNREL